MRSRVGEVVAPVALSDDMMPGVVSLPHGHGHDAPGTKMQVAGRQAGVNSNLLTDELAIDDIDRILQGMLRGPIEMVTYTAEEER